MPLGNGLKLTFLHQEGIDGFVLQIEVFKSRDIIKATSGETYIRRGAQNLPVPTGPALERLQLNKGISSFETRTVDAPEDLITNSTETIGFMLDVVPHQEPEKWLRKQMLLSLIHI